MLTYDNVYSWAGWGGKLRLGNGKCRLRIFDLRKDETAKGVSFLKPIIVVITDVPDGKMTIRSCTSHIATCVANDFNIDPSRMLWIEYYPQTTYGQEGERVISERLEAVEFEWRNDKAIRPKWRPLQPQLLEAVKELISQKD
ncbi:MAG: hypothetical protein WCR46_09010 [Deltaproteobacteria bacterium]|jgi:hypothetical protein